MDIVQEGKMTGTRKMILEEISIERTGMNKKHITKDQREGEMVSQEESIKRLFQTQVGTPILIITLTRYHQQLLVLRLFLKYQGMTRSLMLRFLYNRFVLKKNFLKIIMLNNFRRKKA